MVETVFPRGGRYGSICRMEKIATDTYSFEKLRQNGYVYVDKTDILLSLADGSLGTQFFIARPRRFGKSLAVSTLQCLFEGRRDLFKGLAIEPKWDWSKTWPVLRLDMGSCQAATVEAFWGKLGDLLISESDRLQIPLRGKSPSSQFRFLIEDLARRNRADILAAAKARGEEPPTDVKGQMVLLVDEYDKPLLGHLGRPDVNDIRDALSCFFANIPANITVKREKYYQSLFYAVFVLIGARTHAECWTNRGRVDAVVETANDVYVFEFKLNDTAEAALAQIKAKGYHEKYLRAGKRLTLVGAAFDAEMRNLSDRRIELVAQT